jgi:hypothetical protein
MGLFDEELVLRVPQGTTLALEQAALRARIKPAKYAEHLLLEALDANGYAVGRTSRGGRSV